MTRKIVVAFIAVAATAAPNAVAREPGLSLAAVSPSAVRCADAVSWQRAASLVGQRAVIKGRIVSTYFARSSAGQPTFLDMGNGYPNPNRFTVLIWRENRRTFGGSPETRYRGRSLCVIGLINSYRGVPEIVARSAGQITVVR